MFIVTNKQYLSLVVYFFTNYKKITLHLSYNNNAHRALKD